MNRIIAGLPLMLIAPTLQAQTLQLRSSDIQHNQQVQDAHVLNGSGCTGGNMSPELSWSGAPSSTKSFAVTMFNSDAPTGSGWWHWTIVNIPKDVHSLPRDAGNPSGKNIPAGAVQGRTDFGGPGYGGPCPPSGTHHYHFTVWAVGVEKLPIDEGSSGAMVGYLLNMNSVATAELVPVPTR